MKLESGICIDKSVPESPTGLGSNVRVVGEPASVVLIVLSLIRILSTSICVNPANTVEALPRSISVVPIVILSFASLALLTPPSLTRSVSLSVSIVVSSTETARDTELPSDTEPPPLRPSPAVTVTALFVSFPFAIDPASCVFDTPPALIVTAPEETPKSLELNDATPY